MVGGCCNEYLDRNVGIIEGVDSASFVSWMEEYSFMGPQRCRRVRSVTLQWVYHVAASLDALLILKR